MTDKSLDRQRVLLELARRDPTNVPDTLRAITKVAALSMGVERTSIWRLVDDGSAIVCDDVYMLSKDDHRPGGRILARDAPHYFPALLESRALAADDVTTDPRMVDFRESYFPRLGITSMLDVPIWYRGELYGVLCHEHIGPPRHWTSEEVNFSANLADLVSLSLEAMERKTLERRWEAVIDAIAEMVVVLDADGTIVAANAAARENLERGRVGLTLDARNRTMEYRDTRDRVLPPERWPGPRALRGETVRGELIGLKSLVTGEMRYVRITSAPMREGERVTSAVSILTDVSEEVKFERIKRDFLAALAHELKTPVAISKSYAQLLSRQAGLPERALPMLDAIRRASDRMEKLIADMVDLSSIILGQLVLERAPTDLVAIARTVVERAGRSAPRHRLRLDAPAPVRVLADSSRMEQAIRQLVDNAIRYSPRGGDVEIQVREDAGGAVLAVRDEGIGIPHGQQEHIFEPFYRPHAGTPNDLGGLGLGLYLCREIVLRHGGTVLASSTEGAGSTFTLRLPLFTELPPPSPQ
ncbi:ATP-binding protein [Myxococcaceae bacterium GXIMD 01537]